MTDEPWPGLPATNAEQVDTWNTRHGPRWAALQPEIEAMFAPVTAMLLAEAAPRSGERVVDVGCGCGDTTLRLARMVGPEGAVLGVDVSRPMLEVAARRVAADALTQVRLDLADAAVTRFRPGEADLMLSRFGVMFFDDPVAAFSNLRAALRPGGRLVFACWQPLDRNPWLGEPLAIVERHLGPQPSADPDAPGAFGLARPGRAEAILTGAGWSKVSAQPRPVPVHLAAPGDPAGAAALLTRMAGGVARLFATAEPDVQARMRAALTDHLRGFAGPGGVVMPGAVWLVTGRA